VAEEHTVTFIKREPPGDAKEFDGVPGKFERYFLPISGQGD
jgi:ferredoxin